MQDWFWHQAKRRPSKPTCSLTLICFLPGIRWLTRKTSTISLLTCRCISESTHDWWDSPIQLLIPRQFRYTPEFDVLRQVNTSELGSCFLKLLIWDLWTLLLWVANYSGSSPCIDTILRLDLLCCRSRWWRVATQLDAWRSSSHAFALREMNSFTVPFQIAW